MSGARPGDGTVHGPGDGHARGRRVDRRRLWLVLAVTAAVAAVELVGALLSGSLALLGDAGHMLTDAAAVVLALSASYVATMPASPRRTFGYHRAETLAALLNALVLLGVCGYLVVVAVQRLVLPAHLDAGEMLAFAGVGLAANLLSLGLLAGRREESLNVRAAFLEVLGDTFGSVATIVAGLAVLATGYVRADPIASLVIAALILPRAWALLRECVGVLLESTPRGLDLDEVRRHLCGVDGVIDVHDLHAWTITSGMPAVSAHVRVSEAALRDRGVGPLLDELGDCLAAHFGLDHATLQVEPATHRAHEPGGEHA